MQTRNFLIAAVLTALLLSGILVPSAAAQTLYGSLLGNIADPSGAAVPGVKVVAVNTANGLTREGTTDERGAYIFTDLQPGAYDVKITAASFAAVTRTGVPVSANAVVRIDVQLNLATSAETITVAASAAMLQTDRAEVRSEMNSRQYRDLPISGVRNYTALYKLVPGFTPPTLGHSIVTNPQETLIVNVNGANDEVNSSRLDGASNTHIWMPRLQAYAPPLESIEAVNIVTNSMDAEQGTSGGAATSVTTKSGTNQFHAVAFEYHTNNALRAKNVFSTQVQKTPKYLQNQYGGTIGGPIAKNKLFFFISEEQTSRRWNASRWFDLPTAAQRAGDFSSFGTTIYDPLTGSADGSGRTPMPNNTVPLARQSRAARQMNEWLPQPTIAATTANYFASGSSRYDRNSSDAKVNWNKSDKFTMFGRFSILNFTVWSPTPFDKASGGAIDSGQQAGYGEGRVISTSMGFTYIFKPTFLMDGNIGYGRMAPGTYPIQYGQNIGLDVLKLPGTNGPEQFYSGIPEFAVSGYTSVGNPGQATPYFWHDNQYQYNANATWMKGPHNFRFGLDMSREHLNHMTAESGSGPRGAFQFTGGVTAIRGGVSPNQFNNFAAYMLGLPSTIGKTVATELPTTARAWREGFFARDHWQVARNLTLTLGLRYELYPLMTRAHRGIERYDPKTNKVLLGGIGSVPRDTGVKVSHKLFAPRLGVVYRLGPKWVIRSGYGINIDPYSLSRPYRINYPIVVAMQIVAPNSFAFIGKTEDGIPPVPVPNVSTGVVDIPGTVSANSLPDFYDRGYSHTYNLAVQHELPWGFAGQAGYVGTYGISPTGMQINYAELGQGNNGRVLYKPFGRTAGTSLRTRPPNWNLYNSLQTSLTRRFTGCCQMQAAYTFSKSLSYTGDFELPALRATRNRNISGYDRTHNLHMGWVVEAPFGPRKQWARQGFARLVLSGWQLNGIFSRYSGTPFTVSTSGTSLNTPGNTQTADQVKPEVQILGGTGRGQSYFDPFAFAPVTAVRFGNSGINILRGPGVANLDLGLFREFRPAEKWSIQFRAEAFNATNSPHFNNPGTSVSSMQLNNDGTIRNLGGYTEITGAATDERQIRFGLRISF